MAVEQAFVARGLGYGFAQAPQCLRLRRALSDHRVANHRFFGGPGRRTFEIVAQRAAFAGVGQFDQHVPGMDLGQGLPRARDML